MSAAYTIITTVQVGLIMSKFGKSADEILVSLFEVVIGVLLLISPVGFTKGIITAVGVFLLAMGVMNTVKYFRTAAVEAAKQKLLAKGLEALLHTCNRSDKGSVYI